MNGSDVEIAIVEDNPNDAELMTRVLQKHGLADKYVLLKDGAEALAFLLAQDADAGQSDHQVLKVVLLDLKLPKIDGIEVLRRLKSDERTREIPVVVITSSTEQRDLKAAYALGVNSYVSKPIEFSEFATTLATLATYWLKLNRVPDQ